ncbi:discoidin domain-containing protein, partial [bacterium]|nr:discoidin domain-containing protein [bacterium]
LIAQNINSLANATVRGAGAASASALRAFDGDPTTRWKPPAGTPVEDWWLEIDLGQVFPAQQLRLRFDDAAPPLPCFTLSLSKGERFINSANVVVEGTLLYSASERFAFNEAHELTIDLQDELVQVIRIEATREMVGAPALAEIEIDAFGDNIAFDLVAKGGSVDVEAAIVAVAGTPSVMFDGTLSTMWRVNPLAKGSSGGSATFGDYRVDLGATYWIDSVWFLGEPLGIPPRLRHNYANFLSYQVLYSDGSLAPTAPWPGRSWPRSPPIRTISSRATSATMSRRSPPATCDCSTPPARGAILSAAASRPAISPIPAASTASA